MTDLLLPFSGTTPISRHCSWTGAVKAAPRAGSQCWRLMGMYRDLGPRTDHEAADALDLPLATICARRGWLVKNRWVQAVGTKPGPFGTANTTWGMSSDAS